jgi:exopolysaccharide biosynthesis polyprenyl glycosylphosphotransferase
MINHRLSGLLSLHVFMTTLVALALFSVYVDVFPLLPFAGLNLSIFFAPYLMCVGLGVALAGRHAARFGHRFHRLTWADAANVSTRQTIVVALLIFAFMAATKDRAVSRLFLGSFFGLLWCVLLFINEGLPRLLCRLLFRRRHKLPTLFVGAPDTEKKLREWLATKEALGIQPVGFITPVGDSEDDGESSVPFLGALADIRRVIEEEEVAQVVVLDMPSNRGERRFIVEICQDFGCRLLIHSDLSEQLQHPLVPVIEEGHAFFSLQEEPLEDPLNRLLKRGFDIMLSLPVVLFLLPPLCAVVAIMQRVQAPGPLFFVQKRGGNRRGEFEMLKFRSMYDMTRSDATEAVQARKNDDRIYPFGRIMRKTSLDEFPQFVNVLLGTMSIVGPRPHMPVHDQEFSRHFRGYRTRHFAKPGITGLAQTRGYRGEITDPELLHKRITNDIQYITNWSIWLDVQITIKTVWQLMFPPKTAY